MTHFAWLVTSVMLAAMLIIFAGVNATGQKGADKGFTIALCIMIIFLLVVIAFMTHAVIFAV